MYSLFLLTSVNLGIVPAREIPNSSIRIILVRVVDGHKSVLDLLLPLQMYGLMMVVCLNMLVMASSEFFLSWHGLGHHHARFGYFWLTDWLGTELFNNRDWSFIKLDHWQAGTFLTLRTRYWRFPTVPNLEEADNVHDGAVVQDDVEGLKGVLRDAATSSLAGKVDL